MSRIVYGRNGGTSDHEPDLNDGPLLKDRIRSRLSDLDAVPFVYRKLLSLLNSSYVSAFELGKVIATDQSLSLRVLRMVNSAYNGLTQKVVSVTQAVGMLGLNVVRSFCFCMATYDSFFADPGEESAGLWKRSLGTGLVAKHLAQAVQTGTPEELFVASMLADVGYAALRKHAPREYAKLRQALKRSGDPLQTERDMLGIDHAELGAMVCEAWKLPPLLVTCVRYHHTPDEATSDRQAVALVNIAARAWDCRKASEWPVELLEGAGLTGAAVAVAVSRAEAELDDLGSYMGLSSRSLRTP